MKLNIQLGIQYLIWFDQLGIHPHHFINHQLHLMMMCHKSYLMEDWERG